ncbi:hypothetical protein SGQ44_06810 [Flavobacterium sp. Fl-77]|uniref:Uncharacterized protein n=1 Tax=Flavobacterium flavipigmentatum TaxID=2893884 RepID=A0AAJ2SFD7_9FLAO|nr:MULTISPECIES: hypothetical protein [unclassified Flavobacterium]MDX6181505.1 hypothetical protein [Flavobacterium sp. Fl-33]MDX6185461.1 hypothetical protein [Flavobacterium sp. Fl-77]UFH37564.1 hypothetical protein LNP22_12540 [Flavobacterium sp. F-70]
MIVHDKTLLENLILVEEARSLQEAGFISKEQVSILKNELPVFKSNTNILVRLGFFLLGVFLYLSICGVIALFGLSGINESFFKIVCFIFAIVGFVGAEALSYQNYYQHGLEDAFILGSILNIGIALEIVTDQNELIIATFVAITSFIMYKRYLHLLSMLVFCCSCSAILFYGLFEFGTIGKTILPFVAMIFAVGFYFFTKKLNEKTTQYYYHKGILIANSFCLVLFYLSCNYLVVRELSLELLGDEIAQGKDIPFTYFFYAFTFIVPAIYLVQALKTKDRILLWISFLAIAFSIYTIRFYHSILPIEIALTLGGVFLFGIAYFSIRKLKDNETGLTFKPDRINNSNAILNAEALIVASAFGIKPELKPQASPMDFGGGGFSGGGSGGTF